MPRKSKGPRLYLDQARGQWAIRDGESFVRTGCAEGERAAAEQRLGKYLAVKYKPARSRSPLLADVLLVYQRDYGAGKASKRTIDHTTSNLERWWGDKRVLDVTADNCRAYAATRPPVAGRRDLETLSAAIGYWHREYGPLDSVPTLTLPDKPEPRERWLTRHEAARLLWAARRTPHVARFILLGIYTGTRPGALLALEWSWVDLVRGTMRRRAPRERETTKRRPRVRLGARILAHLRRWRRLDGDAIEYVCHYNGARITKLRRSWGTIRKAAGLGADVTPHTTRHTRATWLMQAGVNPFEASGSLGMSYKTLLDTYGHHHPDWQKAASEV